MEYVPNFYHSFCLRNAIKTNLTSHQRKVGDYQANVHIHQMLKALTCVPISMHSTIKKQAISRETRYVGKSFPWQELQQVATHLPWS